MRQFAFLLPLALAACATVAPTPPVPIAVAAPVTAFEPIDGRWTVTALNGRPVSGPWIEFFGTSLRYQFACNGGGGDVERVGNRLSTAAVAMTERGCDDTRMAIDAAAIAVIRGTMTMAFTTPRQLRLVGERGTLDLVRTQARADADPYRAIGTEPFWSLTIDDQQMVFTEANAPGVRVVEATPKVIHGFAGESYQARRIRVNIVHGRCSDGMSERVYPDTVQLGVDGRHFAGCGGEPTVAVGRPSL